MYHAPIHHSRRLVRELETSPALTDTIRQSTSFRPVWPFATHSSPLYTDSLVLMTSTPNGVKKNNLDVNDLRPWELILHFNAAITWHGHASRLPQRSAETGFLDTPLACICRWRHLRIMSTRSRKGGVEACVETVAYSAQFFHRKSLPDIVTAKKDGWVCVRKSDTRTARDVIRLQPIDKAPARL